MAGPDRRDRRATDAGRERRDVRQPPRHPRHGSDWFRELGTAESPGTVVCTVSGDTVRSGVAEIELGHPAAGGARAGRRWRATRPRARRGPVRGRQPGADAQCVRHAAELRGDARGRGRASAPPGSSCSTTPPTSSPSPPGWRGSSRSSRAVSAATARTTASRSRPCWRSLAGVRGPTRDEADELAHAARPRRRGCPVQPRHPAAGGRGQHPRTVPGARRRAHHG